VFDPARLVEIAAGAHPAAVCTVTDTQGSTPRKAGASMVVIDDGTPQGSIEGTIGGGAVEHAVRAAALAAIGETAPRTLTIALSKELGMCCGGSMTFFIEPLRLKAPCIVLGAGHCAQALSALAARAGFSVTVADPREELLRPELFPDAAALVDDYASSDLDRLPFAADAFVVVATHDHPTDQQLVERVLTRPARYLALVGSTRKAMLTRERCLNKGFTQAQIERLRCPAGLDIGAETPAEIALSIVAEMVQVRRSAAAEERRTRGAPAQPASVVVTMPTSATGPGRSTG
jgi:xanthine dehydrogenase accessory factor